MDIWHIIIAVEGLLLITLYCELLKMQKTQQISAKLQFVVDDALKNWLSALEERLNKMDKEEKNNERHDA